MPQDEQDQLRDSIMKRASLLQGEATGSAIQQDQEMQNCERDDFEEVAVEECSEDEVEEVMVEDEASDGDELRDQVDDAMLAQGQLHQEEKRAEHNSIIHKLDGSLTEKEKLLDAIKASQQ